MPFEAVSVCPTVVVPETVGLAVFAGAALVAACPALPATRARLTAATAAHSVFACRMFFNEILLWEMGRSDAKLQRNQFDHWGQSHRERCWAEFGYGRRWTSSYR